MQTAGLLGGMAWPSTAEYYILLNMGVEKRAGNNHSAKCIIYSFDFDLMNLNYRTEQEICIQLEKGISVLSAGGADIILICSNTVHKLLDRIREKYSPGLFLDIRDCIGKYLMKKGSKNCLLLGTKFTMGDSFYKDYLSSNFSINVTVPDEHHQLKIHEFIFKELVNNQVSDQAINYFTQLINEAGTDAIILGCTELRLVVSSINTQTSIIDSTEVHVNAAIDYLFKQ